MCGLLKTRDGATAIQRSQKLFQEEEMSRRKQAKPRSVKGKRQPAAGPSHPPKPKLIRTRAQDSPFSLSPMSANLNMYFSLKPRWRCHFDDTDNFQCSTNNSVSSIKVMQDEVLIVDIGTAIQTLSRCQREDSCILLNHLESLKSAASLKVKTLTCPSAAPSTIFLYLYYY